MGFYWVGFIFWFLIVASFLLLILGLWKKSWKVLICSGIFLILPSLYFGGAENWFRLLVLFPLIPFVLAFYIKKKFSPFKRFGCFYWVLSLKKAPLSYSAKRCRLLEEEKTKNTF